MQLLALLHGDGEHPEGGPSLSKYSVCVSIDAQEHTRATQLTAVHKSGHAAEHQSTNGLQQPEHWTQAACEVLTSMLLGCSRVANATRVTTFGFKLTYYGTK